MHLAKELGPNHTIVTILCDYGTRYQSKLFNPSFLKSKGLPVPKWLLDNPVSMPSVLRNNPYAENVFNTYFCFISFNFSWAEELLTMKVGVKCAQGRNCNRNRQSICRGFRKAESPIGTMAFIISTVTK